MQFYIKILENVKIFLFFTWSCHIRGSRWFDFFNATKCFFLKDLVKICDDFIQEPKALHTFVVCFQLDIKFAKVWNWGENYADARTLFVVQILKKGNCMISQHKSQIQKKNLNFFSRRRKWVILSFPPPQFSYYYLIRRLLHEKRSNSEASFKYR